MSLDENNIAISDYDGIGVALSLRIVSFINQLIVQYEFRNLMPKPYFFAKVKNNDIFSKVPALIRAFLFTERLIKFVLRQLQSVFDTILRINRFSIYIKSEEVPFIDSTLSIDLNSGDKLAYSHKVSNQTFELLRENIKKFQKSFNNAFDADFRLYKEMQDLGLFQDFFGPNWHPMGTTKMGLESSNSICNSNLQVHGIDNLYIVSAAVFPTGSNSNPTFTALALVNRLIESDYF